MKKLITFIFFLSIGMSIQAQDFVFSQFHLSPLNLNPALTGTNCGDQVIVNYRDQWRNVLADAAYKTLSVSYDKSLQLKNGNVIGVGAKFTNDEAGRTSFTKRNSSLLFSYQKRIFENNETEHFVIGGLESGLGQYTGDFSNLRWGTQHNGDGGFDSTLVSGEDFDDSVFFADFATGVSYRIKFDEQRSFSIGASVNHLSKPNVSFSETGDSRLYRRFALHASYDLKLSEQLLVSPRVAYYDQGPSELTVGSLGIKYLFKNHSLEANVGGRFVPVGETAYFVSPAFFFNNKVGFAATLEFNTNELNRSGIDSYEGSFIYRFGNCQSKKVVE